MIDVTAPPYSAVGDGFTDDTAALQAALDHGGHVYIPGGTYLIATTPLRISARTRLTLAPDATILRGSGPGLLRNRHDDDNFGGYTGRGQLLVEGGVWDMAGATPGATALSASAFSLTHAEDITLRDLTVRDVPGAHGTDLMGLRKVRIRDVLFTGYAVDPSDSQPRESIQIDGAYGSYSGDCAPFDATACEDVIVQGCRFAASANLPAPMRAVGSHGMLADVQGHEPRLIKILDNTISGVTDSGIWAWCWTNSQISGNQIDKPGAVGIAVREDSLLVDVVDNQILDSGTSGLYINSSAGAPVPTSITLRDNLVIGSSRNAAAGSPAICVQGGAKLIDIIDNRARMRSTGNGASYGLYVSSSCSQIYRSGNDLRSSGVTASRRDDSPTPVVGAADAL